MASIMGFRSAGITSGKGLTAFGRAGVGLAIPSNGKNREWKVKAPASGADALV
jgi:hypothetical protein